ncbi:hypothetical protein PMZ80_000413 [Knufia obscura]|uniref:Myb-like domain-containing protein n=1 Tax=Knufia obscura TaxID=1635080 RepID=A0ABR0S0B5_9EURO|nr:hypothetical protein PMZ80_000413 [Knufia obscura]
MASTSASPHSTRKRARESAGDTDDSPSKKRARATVDEEAAHTTQIHAPASTASRSKTRLSRPSLPLSATPKPGTRRSANQYEVPESPEKTKEKEVVPEKLKAKPKKATRKLGQKKATNASPFKGKGFDGLDELKSGAVLTSYDSPAKNVRSRQKNPLDRIRLHNLQKQDDEGGDPQKQRPKSRPTGETTEAGGKEGSSSPMSQTGDQDRPVSEEVVGNPQDLEDGEPGSSGSHTNESEEDEPGQQLQRESSQSEQQRSTQEASRPQQRQTSGQRQDVSNQEGAESATSPQQLRLVPEQQQQRTKSPIRSIEQEQISQETEESGPEQSKAEQGRQEPMPSKRRRRLPAVSEEEREARREAEARKRAENAVESEAAELADFEKRGQKFVQGIEEVVEQLGGVQAWSKMGAGAKTITAMVAKKNEMETARCQAVWRHMRNLSRWFKGLEDAEAADIEEASTKLKARATWKFLSSDGNTKRGDQAIIEIYEHLIPHSVYLVRNAVKRRFVEQAKQPWQELLPLVDIAICLCDIASQWTPKPSNLESGIRGQVRNSIRPGMNDVRAALQEHLDMLEYQEKNRRRAETLKRNQEAAKAKRARQLAAMKAGMSSCRATTERGSRSIRHEQLEEVDDIDDLEDHELGQSTGSRTAQRLPRAATDTAADMRRHSTGVRASEARSRIEREATEEIPAPDPTVTWTDAENTALLNGLQRYTGTDRYTRILEEFIVLNMKDIDQCMARARFYREGMLAAEARGGRCPDWLRLV